MTLFNLFILMLTLILLFVRVRHYLRHRPRKPSTPHNFSRRKLSAQTQNNRTGKNRKPGWVQTEVLRLLAITRGHAGCRTVAAMFNARFAFRGV